ncbi:MAG: sugar transferase [Acidobacteriota bacterium]
MIRPNSLERNLRFLLVAAGDLLIAAGCISFAVFIRRNITLELTRSLLPPEKFPLDVWNILLPALSLGVAMALSGFYNPRVSRRHKPLLITALVVQVGLVAVGATLLTRPYPRTILIAVPVLEAFFLPLWRRLVKYMFPIRARETVLVGAPEDLGPFLKSLSQFPDARIDVNGLAGPGPLESGDIPYWGKIEDPGVASRLHDVDELIYVAHESNAELRMMLLRIRGARGFLLLPSHGDALITSAAFGWVGDQPLVEIAARGGFGLGGATKRTVDLVVGSLMLVLSLPLWAVVALAILLDDGRPLLIRQRRAGRDRQDFLMWKFRTMHAATNSDDRRIALEGDERITRVGLWLRRHRLDELPQLLNILAGEMSLVGPRPERPEIIDEICQAVPGFDLRLIVRPGLAGLAQVWAEYDTEASIKLRYDLTYICSWSLALDSRILLRAVSTALSGRGL